MNPLLKKLIDNFSPIDKGSTLVKLNAIATNPLFSDEALVKINNFFNQLIVNCPANSPHLKVLLKELQKKINQICKDGIKTILRDAKINLVIDVFNPQKIIGKVIKYFDQDIKTLTVAAYLAVVELFGKKSTANKQVLEEITVELIKNINHLSEYFNESTLKNDPLVNKVIKLLQNDGFLPAKNYSEMLGIWQQLMLIVPLMLEEKLHLLAAMDLLKSTQDEKSRTGGILDKILNNLAELLKYSINVIGLFEEQLPSVTLIEEIKLNEPLEPLLDNIFFANHDPKIAQYALNIVDSLVENYTMCNFATLMYFDKKVVDATNHEFMQIIARLSSKDNINAVQWWLNILKENLVIKVKEKLNVAIDHQQESLDKQIEERKLYATTPQDIENFWKINELNLKLQVVNNALNNMTQTNNKNSMLINNMTIANDTKILKFSSKTKIPINSQNAEHTTKVLPDNSVALNRSKLYI